MSLAPDVVVLLHDVRSLYNVGAVLRACDGAGVRRVIACGITPYPSQGAQDTRRGPVAARAERELRKTALSALRTVRVEPVPSAAEAITGLRAEGHTIVAVERSPQAVPLWECAALDARRLALLLGHEVEGVPSDLLSLADAAVEIPMLGAGTSLNVSIAAAIMLYEIVRRRR